MGRSIGTYASIPTCPSTRYLPPKPINPHTFRPHYPPTSSLHDSPTGQSAHRTPNAVSSSVVVTSPTPDPNAVHLEVRCKDRQVGDRVDGTHCLIASRNQCHIPFQAVMREARGLQRMGATPEMPNWVPFSACQVWVPHWQVAGDRHRPMWLGGAAGTGDGEGNGEVGSAGGGCARIQVPRCCMRKRGSARAQEGQRLRGALLNDAIGPRIACGGQD